MGLRVSTAPTMGWKNPSNDGAAPPPPDHRGVPDPPPKADHTAPPRSKPDVAPLGRGPGCENTRQDEIDRGEHGLRSPCHVAGGWTHRNTVHPPRLAGQPMPGRDNPTAALSYDRGNTGRIILPPPRLLDNGTSPVQQCPGRPWSLPSPSQSASNAGGGATESGGSLPFPLQLGGGADVTKTKNGPGRIRPGAMSPRRPAPGSRSPVLPRSRPTLSGLGGMGATHFSGSPGQLPVSRSLYKQAHVRAGGDEEPPTSAGPLPSGRCWPSYGRYWFGMLRWARRPQG